MRYMPPMDPRAQAEHGRVMMFIMLWPFKFIMPLRMRAWHKSLLEPLDDAALDWSDPLPPHAYACTNPACGCSTGKGDLPPVREIVVNGPPVTRELELVFGAFGKPIGVVLQDDGVPHVFYEDGSELAFHPIAVA